MNEYSVLSMASATTDFLKIVTVLNDRGLIDGIGEQGHFYERAELPVLSANLNALTATGLPVYISELDINFANDARQAVRMSELFPLFWSNPSVLGVTHWGYLQGTMWRTDAYLLRTDGTPRPALTWLECYKAGGTDCPVPTYVPEARKGDNSGITLDSNDSGDVAEDGSLQSIRTRSARSNTATALRPFLSGLRIPATSEQITPNAEKTPVGLRQPHCCGHAGMAAWLVATPG